MTLLLSDKMIVLSDFCTLNVTRNRKNQVKYSQNTSISGEKNQKIVLFLTQPFKILLVFGGSV